VDVFEGKDFHLPTGWHRAGVDGDRDDFNLG
jgi:hypothetical protein